MGLFFIDATYMANQCLEHGPCSFILFYSRPLQIVGDQVEQLGKGLERTEVYVAFDCEDT